jgi:hypothetical protein
MTVSATTSASAKRTRNAERMYVSFFKGIVGRAERSPSVDEQVRFELSRTFMVFLAWPKTVWVAFFQRSHARQCLGAHRFEVGYPITDNATEKQNGAKGPVLIPWMGSEQLVWITKDDEAKRAHINDIRRQGVSVVWVRGLERGKNRVSPHDLHLMLTLRLRYIAQLISTARRAVHVELYLFQRRESGCSRN